MNLNKHGGSCSHSCCLRIQNLSVQIGSEKILDNINLHVHCGELVALIGPNGAGKSTLLKAILGQQEHTGTIAFSVPGQRNRKVKIGYVPQTPSFDPGDPVTVADLFACCMSKRPAFLGISKAMQETILTCLRRVRAEELIHKRVGTLSGGELQRILLALALEPLPNVLILDEPLSGVDAEGMESLMEMLDDILADYDLSIVMTTHDYAMLHRYADQVYLIDRSVVAHGTPAEVLDSQSFHMAFQRKGGI